MHAPPAPEDPGLTTADRGRPAGSGRPRRDAEPTPRRASIRGALQRTVRRRPTGPDIIAALVFAVAGTMFVAGATASGGEDLRVDRTGGLRGSISELSEENRALQAEVDALAAQVAELQAVVGPGSAAAETLALSAELAPQVGLTEVRGPGITVTLEDAPAPAVLPDGLTGDDYLVHQEDVEGVVNALWRGGASGVTMMGQRLVSTSAVRCVGNTVILHGRVYSPPFVIAAVGDVPRMEAALEAEPAVQFFREWADVVGLGYEQVTADELVLPPYTGPIAPDYAQVTS